MVRLGISKIRFKKMIFYSFNQNPLFWKLVFSKIFIFIWRIRILDFFCLKTRNCVERQTFRYSKKWSLLKGESSGSQLSVVSDPPIRISRFMTTCIILQCRVSSLLACVTFVSEKFWPSNTKTHVLGLNVWNFLCCLVRK